MGYEKPDSVEEVNPRNWREIVTDGCPRCGSNAFIQHADLMQRVKPNSGIPPTVIAVNDLRDVYCDHCGLNIVTAGEIDCETTNGET